MSQFKIDKKMPMPYGGNTQCRYPWRDMDVGDSFFVPDKKITQIDSRTAQISTGFRFAKRTVEENDIKGVRIWRIS